jgi:hypothetical protein
MAHSFFKKVRWEVIKKTLAISTTRCIHFRHREDSERATSFGEAEMGFGGRVHPKERTYGHVLW